MDDGFEKRALVRLLLRGLTYVAGETPSDRVIGAHVVIIIGEPRAKDWPHVRLRAGDVEGIVWTTRRSLPSTVNELRASAGVVDAHGEESEPTLPPPKTR